jgi:lipopolysaccharide export system protein LptA
VSGLDLAWRALAGIAGLLLVLPAAAAPFPNRDAPRIAIGVAAFESSGPAGAPGPDVARLLADRIGTHGVHAVVGPGELGSAGSAEPTPAQIQSWAAAAAVSTIAVGRATWIGGRQSIDVRLRTGDSGGLLGTYVAEASTPEELASGVDRLAGEIVAATTAWLEGGEVRAAAPPESRERREARDPKESPFGIGGFDSDQPLSIRADELEASQIGGARRLVFKKGVRVQQADLTLDAARLEAFYPEKASQPERLVATGGVKVVQGLREARCDQATYFRSEQRLHCEGNAELRDGEDRVAGSVIEFDLAAERVIVTGGATVFFHPEPESPPAADDASAAPVAGPAGVKP